MRWGGSIGGICDSNSMEKYNWERLSSQQLGKYAEYFTKMEFTLFGWDIYSPEIDDKGIDFILRKTSIFLEIQVKSARLEKTNYVFIPKDKFSPKKNLFLSLALFENLHLPKLYIIPSEAWLEPNDLLADMHYGVDKKSKPEFGLRLSQKNLHLLKEYRFHEMIEKLVL